MRISASATCMSSQQHARHKGQVSTAEPATSATVGMPLCDATLGMPLWDDTVGMPNSRHKYGIELPVQVRGVTE
jgi:hypothetical protein